MAKASLLTLLRGSLRRNALCPHCGSSTVRPSRDSYSGWWAGRLRLQPYRCRECQRLFAVPAGTPPPAAVTDVDDRHAGHRIDRPLPMRCPHCGHAHADLSAQPVIEWWHRFLGRRRYRCKACQRHFLAARAMDMAASLLLGFVLLGGLAFVAYQARDLVQKAGAPKARRWAPHR
jgi:transposase-like protein